MRQSGASIFFSLLLPNLNKVAERKRLNSSNNTVLSSSLKEVSSLGLKRLTLEVNLYSSLLGLNFGKLVGNLAGDDFLLTGRLPDVLNAYMDTLLKDASVDGLVDTNSNGRLGNVENDTSTSVVVLERHTLMNGRITEDINVVTNLHRHEVLRKVWQSVLTVLLLEHVAGSSASSE